MTLKEAGEEGEKTRGRKRANEKIRSYLHHSQLETYTNNTDPRMGMFGRNTRDFDLFILWEEEGGKEGRRNASGRLGTFLSLG